MKEKLRPCLPLAFWALAFCLCLLPACSAASSAPHSAVGAFQVGFSPKGESLNIILKAVNSAEKSILALPAPSPASP